MPVTSDLLTFIRSGLAAGVSRDLLTQSLIQNHWQLEDITAAFDSLQTSAPPPAPASIPAVIAPATVATTPAAAQAPISVPITAAASVLSPGQHAQMIAATSPYGEVDDLRKGTFSYVWKHHRDLFLASMIFGIALTGVLIFLFIVTGAFDTSASSDTSSNSFQLLILCFLPLFLPLSVYGYFRNKRAHVFEEEVAAFLNLTYQANGDTTELFAHLLTKKDDFLTSSRIAVQDLMFGTYQNIPLKIFTFIRVIPRGRSAERLVATVFECTTGAALPDLILNPVASALRIASRTSTDIQYSGVPKGYTLLPLEGNFDKYFQFYIPQGSQIDALQILQPDIMALLIDKYPTTAFEFTGNKFYVYPGQLLCSRQEFIDSLALVQQIYTRILPTLQEMQPRPPQAGAV